MSPSGDPPTTYNSWEPILQVSTKSQNPPSLPAAAVALCRPRRFGGVGKHHSWRQPGWSRSGRAARGGREGLSAILVA